MTNFPCMAVQPIMNCRSQSYEMDDEQLRESCCTEMRHSLHSANASNRTTNETAGDSKQMWVDEDDEYSCNSSSDSSGIKLIDEDSKSNQQRNSHLLTSTRNNHDRMSCDDCTDTRDITCHSTYESANNEAGISSIGNIRFCWLPHDSNKGPLSPSNNSGIPYHNYMYVGIKHNPPIVCAEGVSRGNVRTLHRKAWLEVSDEKHRYGKHLRMYYRHWESLYILPYSCSAADEKSAKYFGTFFDWLDSKGNHEGKPFPEIPDCPRTVLDSDTVTYIDDRSLSRQYETFVVGDKNGFGRLILPSNRGSNSDCDIVRTGSSGWMFIIRDNVMYVAPKVVTGSNGVGFKRFHHSSFFGGRAVQAAGIIVTDEITGFIQHVLPHSGHYRPGESDVQRVLYFLLQKGVCWSTFSVDIQQFLFVDRSTNVCANGHCSVPTSCSMKKKKVESLHLLSAVTVADFLSHKACCMQPRGIFSEIEALRCSSY